MGRRPLVILCLAAAGCFAQRMNEAAVTRAANEFACPRSAVSAAERPDLGPGAFDIAACGRLARYSCATIGYGTIGCAREPDPAPGETAPRPSRQSVGAAPEGAPSTPPASPPMFR